MRLIFTSTALILAVTIGTAAAVTQVRKLSVKEVVVLPDQVAPGVLEVAITAEQGPAILRMKADTALSLAEQIIRVTHHHE
jgi:hypothetical protein